MVGRLSRAVPILVESEFNAFVKLIESDTRLTALLNSLVERERHVLRPFIEEFATGRPLGENVSLHFADTLERRAAFGFLVIKGLLSQSYPNPLEKGNRFADLGEKYPEPGRGQMSALGKIDQFVNVFVEPIVDYLDATLQLDDVILATMLRYKTRGEWFEVSSLLETAAETPEEDSSRNQVEQRLKMDFYKYLFDQGVDFTVAPEPPNNQSEVDILTARFPDGRRLVVEGKVFDGSNRDVSHIKAGVPQAAKYAKDWGEPIGYLLIYNVLRDSVVGFSGAREIGGCWSMQALGVEVRAVVLNLDLRLRASESAKLKPINVDVTSLE